MGLSVPSTTTDSLAMSILALECFKRQGKAKLTSQIEGAVKALAEVQDEEGSFNADFHTTLLALQVRSYSSWGGG